MFCTLVLDRTAQNKPNGSIFELSVVQGRGKLKSASFGWVGKIEETETTKLTSNRHLEATGFFYGSQFNSFFTPIMSIDVPCSGRLTERFTQATLSFPESAS